MNSLPIDKVLAELVSRLENANRVILHAPPGAGKTTRVPLYLLEHAEWLGDMKIIMLEPRRLAARAAAYRMAESLGEDVGATVGYRTRLDTKVSSKTRIEVVTEGILTRMLQSDPELREVACVIFDEFHERSLHADLGLALSLDMQSALREDLRLLLMSATLDVEALKKLLGDAPVVSSSGQSFPVDIHYLGWQQHVSLVEQVAQAVNQVLCKQQGSVLVFLPGEREIRHVEEKLKCSGLQENILLYPLYGALSREDQYQAIQPCSADNRKIVLATSIAETSLTIEGVRVVIDAGFMRVAQFDSHTAMSRLHTLRVSEASAKQRCGRAGRTQPGVCYRLWSEEQQRGLVKFNNAEILSADLTSLALELAQWGVRQPAELSWVDQPPIVGFERAQQLLQQLGALNAQLQLTEHGREILSLGLHPRLAHMVLKAKKMGLGNLACDVAALLEERDIFKKKARDVGAALSLRLAVLTGDAALGKIADASVVKRVKKVAAQLRAKLALKNKREDMDQLGVVLSFAYPDRIAKRRQGRDAQFLLNSGKGTRLDELDKLCREQYLVVANLGGHGKEPLIRLAAAINERDVLLHHEALIENQARCVWDATTMSVRCRSERKLGAIVIEGKPLGDIVNVDQVTAALIDAIYKSNLALLNFQAKHRQWLARVNLAGEMIACGKLTAPCDEAWPTMREENLLGSLTQWLAPYLDGVSSAAQLNQLDLLAILKNCLTWLQQKWLDEMFPQYYVAPTGTRVAIDYEEEDGPLIAVRLQEMFGIAQTPTVAQGALTLKLHLLSPARRPIQVTRDLAGFWQGSYNEVKKEMKGRYPKHPWPDDPMQAQATKYAKPRK